MLIRTRVRSTLRSGRLAGRHGLGRLVLLCLVATVCLPSTPTSAEVEPPEPFRTTPFAGVTAEPVNCSHGGTAATCRELVAVAESAGEVGPGDYPTGFVAPEMDLSHLTLGDLSGRLASTSYMSETFDWRNDGGMSYVTPIGDQGACGACYAFAAVANAESYGLVNGEMPAYDFSENQAKDCTWWAQNVPGWGGCTGGNYLSIADLWVKQGIASEATDPYTDSEMPCQSSSGPWVKTVTGWQQLSGPTTPTTMSVKQALVSNGPLYTALYVGDAMDPAWDSEFNTYDGSYALRYTGTVTKANHAVVLVGWDDTMPHTGGKGAWIAKNHWGTGWGDSGYFYIAYGSAEVGTYLSTITDWQDADPNGWLYAYDEGGWNAFSGFGGADTAWGMAVFTTTDQTNATHVGLWAPDAMSDVDVYVYDDFSGGAPTGMLWQGLDNTFDAAGYYSVPIDPSLPLAPGEDVAVVVKYTAVHTKLPVPTDAVGPSSGASYTSPDGSTWVTSTADVGIHLRTSEKPVDLELAKDVFGRPPGGDFGPADPITFSLTLENRGTALAMDTVLTDTMPTEVISTAVTSTLAITETGPVDYVWNVEPLGPGQRGVITITGIVSVTQVGQAFQNEAVVFDPMDGRLANNRAVAKVGIQNIFLPLVIKNYPPLQTRTFDAVDDATVLQGRPNTNTGGEDYLWSGFGLSGCPADTDNVAIARALMHFDLSTLPAPAVESATLHVREFGHCGYTGAAAPVVRAFRVAQPWDAATVIWNASPAAAEGYGAVTINHSDGQWDWYQLDVTGLVNAWLGGSPNHGVMLRAHEAGDADAMITTFLSQETGLGPYIVVEYYGPN